MSKMGSFIIDQEEAGYIVYDEEKGEHYCAESKNRNRNPLSQVGHPTAPVGRHEDRRQFPVRVEESNEGEVGSPAKAK